MTGNLRQMAPTIPDANKSPYSRQSRGQPQTKLAAHVTVALGDVGVGFFRRHSVSGVDGLHVFQRVMFFSKSMPRRSNRWR